MIIRWLEDALNDLESLRDYIGKDNPIAAVKVVKKILSMIELISEHPAIGREGRVPNTRELIISGLPYIVPYRVEDKVIEILRVFHAAMRWPENESGSKNKLKTIT